MPTAFVTGGSGFIGGALIERLRRRGLGRPRRWRARTAPPAAGRATAAPSRSPATSTTRRRCAPAPSGAEAPSTPPPGRGLGRPGGGRARQRAGHAATCSPPARAAGVRRLRARRHRGGADGGRAARERRRDARRCGPTRRRSTPSSKAKAEQRGARRQRRRARDRGDPAAASSGAAATRRCCRRWSSWSASGRFRWVGGGHAPDRHDARRQHRRGPRGWARPRARPAASTSSPTASRSCSASSSARLLETQGVDAARPSRCRRRWRGPRPAPPSGAGGCLRRPGAPPLTRFAVWVSSQECTIDIGRAERELGYRPVKARDGGPGGAGQLAGDRRAVGDQAQEEERKRPTAISSPSSSSARSTRSPLRNTPLRLRSSSMRAPSGSQ